MPSSHDAAPVGQLARVIPALGWLPKYRLSNVGRDIAVGISIWALVAPMSIAYASLADVPVQIGLYAMVPAMIVYALFGPSPQLIVGVSATTAALVPLAVASVTDTSANDYLPMCFALSIAVGLIYLALGVLRMGWVANFLSRPVVTGFITGFGITLVIGQLHKILGFSVPDEGSFREVWYIVSHLDETSVTTLTVGALALLALFGLRHFLPRVPDTIVVVVAAVIATRVFSLEEHGVAVVGSVPTGLPDFGFPSVGLEEFATLLGAGVAVVIVGFSEALGAAQAMARKHGQSLDVNQEFVANGLANVASGLSQGIVVNGSLSKTAANDTAGATTQMSSLIAAFMGLLTLLFLAGLFEDLPQAVLGAIVVQAAIGLIDVPELRRVRRIAPLDFAAAVAALLGTLVANILVGMLIGVALSLLLLVHRASHIRIHVLGRARSGVLRSIDAHPDYEQISGALVLRVYGGLFFAPAAEFVKAVAAMALEGDARPAHVVLDLGAVPYVDVTGVDALEELNEMLERNAVELHLAAVHSDVMAVLEQATLPLLSESGRVHDTVDEAVAVLAAKPVP